MTDNLSYEESCLLSIISSALSGSSFVSLEKSPDWMTVIKLAKSHAVCSLLYNVLAERDDLPDDCRKTLVDESRKAVLQSYRLLFLSKSVVDLLEEIDIPALVLKGACASKLYPVPELRKSGDVDIFLLKPERIDDACRMLEKSGFIVDSEQHSEHHVGMKSPDNIEVELHTMLAEPFDSDRINRYVNDIALKCADNYVTEDVMGVSLPRLTDAYQAFSLLVHMLNHFLRAGFGLKLLCDWVVFWNREYNEETESLYLKLVKDCGIKGFSDIVTRTCVRYLGLKYDNVRFMLEDDGSDEHKEADIDSFIREVLDAEEFGKSDDGRLVVLRGTKITDYIREFHHRTCHNFPRASRVFILLPVLWIVTLWRFIRNNRKLRHVSTRSVLKNARERSKLIKSLKLFKEM